jgi:FkbM family methyltransferase
MSGLLLADANLWKMPLRNTPLFSNGNWLSAFLRRPLRHLPKEMSVPILCGPSCGMRWIVGAGPHSYWIGTYEADKQKSLQRLLRRGDCFLDVGAHVGFYSLLASRIVGRTGRVVAFEPLPRNLHFLERHLRLNGIRNVSVFEAAVSDTVGILDFAEGEDSSSGRLDQRGTLRVETITLDSLWQKKAIPSPRVIKIDVEGAEAAVLNGASALLTAVRPVILLAGHGWDKQKECRDILTRLAYRLVMTRDGAADGMYESIAFPLSASDVGS